MNSFVRKIAVGVLAVGGLPGVVVQAATSDRVRVTGEVIDTWCYVSQVMGASDAVTGSAHHTCALWCAAGGIPVGIKAEDGTVYMVLKLGDDFTSNANLGVLDLQSHQVTVDGTLHRRDGINYLLVDQVVDDAGVVNINHTTYGVIPPFAAPGQ